jgi:hypothetical protein
MHAVIRYVVWVARNSTRPKKEELRLERGMEEVKEARELLEWHLDRAVEASLAVRSVYGRYFPLLSAIAPEWSSAIRERVFPRDEGDNRLWWAAWNGYVMYNGVSAVAVELLAEYRRAVDHCDEFKVDDRFSNEAHKQLAEHLMILFGRGVLDLDGESLVARFFSRVPVELQEHAVKFVGRSLSGGKSPPSAVIDRFMRLWAWLANRAAQSPSESPERKPLAAFGSWFASERFDPAWSFEALEKALGLAGQVEDSHAVIQTLSGSASKFLGPSLRCLRALIESDREGWAVSGAMEEVRAILRGALGSADEGLAEEGTNIVHDLGRRGFHSLRALLREANEDRLRSRARGHTNT